MEAGYYNGKPADPGVITGLVERVVVVGAGITGLTTANVLTYAGVECVVLEALDRLGGVVTSKRSQVSLPVTRTARPM